MFRTKENWSKVRMILLDEFHESKGPTTEQFKVTRRLKNDNHDTGSKL